MAVNEEEFGNEILESGFNTGEKIAADGDFDDDGRPRRTGTVWTAGAHIITAVIGAGVLSLAWAIAQLGWIAGIGILLSFVTVTLYTSNLLADCYRFPDPVYGNRNYTYMDAVRSILGGTMYLACGWIQYGNLTGFVISYTITSSTSVVAIRKSNCFHERGRNASCKFSNNPSMIGVGIVEIFLSQIPNFHKLSWLSTLAAIMSFGYASIGIFLSIARIISGEGGRTSLTGIEVGVDISASDKVWSMFNAIGDIAFACAYSQILFDIQDTLRSSPPEYMVMKKANQLGMMTMTTFFIMCGSLGYAAFGDHAPGNLLTGFGFYEPFWLVDLANLMIVVHLVGAYQVLCQPVFRVVETWATTRWPRSNFINKEYPIKMVNKGFNINFLRLTWRTVFVTLATILAMAMPFFNSMIALLGAIGYWPLVVYFPVEMYIAQKNIPKLTFQWVGLQLLNLVCLLVSLAAACGAIQGLNSGLRAAEPFHLKQ